MSKLDEMGGMEDFKKAASECSPLIKAIVLSLIERIEELEEELRDRDGIIAGLRDSSDGRVRSLAEIESSLKNGEVSDLRPAQERKQGHFALRIRDGQLERFDPYEEIKEGVVNNPLGTQKRAEEQALKLAESAVPDEVTVTLEVVPYDLVQRLQGFMEENEAMEQDLAREKMLNEKLRRLNRAQNENLVDQHATINRLQNELRPLRQLFLLMKDPHPGLMTWNEAVNQTLQECG